VSIGIMLAIAINSIATRGMFISMRTLTTSNINYIAISSMNKVNLIIYPLSDRGNAKTKDLFIIYYLLK